MLSTVRSIPRAEFDQWLADGGGGMMGTQLLTLKGCTACHSLDGSPLIAPTFQGIWGRTEMVRKGDALYEVVVDADYVRRSIRDPNEEIVDGFQPQMPSMEGLVSDEDLEAIIKIFQSPDLAGGGE
jgi:cytochrome c oxidase subunit 2